MQFIDQGAAHAGVPFRITSPIGPVLFLDDVAGSQLLLSALFITARDDAPPPIVTAAGESRVELLAGYANACVWRARFRAVGFIGVMTVGMHHQAHHLALAVGQNPHAH
ncbi:hypothetical protein K1T73_06885 [Roseovarius sp. SCSIO 43702]|uniref:hypothetical protein n=1 Tax=Roseovarius sp. SCSIO 43702 TaxID=2823043 RepID=UPI001C739AF9|nr:hypothetical protein [Roseovarius sp. SCSIO 43702]QYX58087.1 hypothetical protein K1T73_06885 [Roseovarius sp. SCSIO 43702]